MSSRVDGGETLAPVLPGETLAGKYRVERVLGEGGMGIVVGARHIDLDERVAIKFLIGEPSEGAVERFLREARAAAKVKGEHVCRVFDFGRLETGEPYIVMEHLEGIDLSRKLAKEGRQPVDAVVGWIVEICDAIAEAHALGIVHRDLKPANVFLATRAHGATSAKVLDFGISKLPSHQMTRTAVRMGSPAYMSPEQMESSRDVDARSDIWSLGAMLYELLDGRPPFMAESLVQLTVMIREKEPKPIEGIPDGLARVISKCLAKNAADRYTSVAALAVDLAAFAPPEAQGLMMRLERRLPHTSALAVTGHSSQASTPAARELVSGAANESNDDDDDEKSTPHVAAASTPSPEDDEASPLASTSEPGADDEAAMFGSRRGTFPPLSSPPPEPVAPTRRWPALLVGAAATGAVVVLLRFGGSEKRSSVAAVVGAPPPTQSASVAEVVSSAPPDTMAPPPVAPSSAPPPFTARRGVTKVPALVPPASVPAPALQAPEPSIASVVAPPPAPPTASAPAGRKRTLDRDDP